MLTLHRRLIGLRRAEPALAIGSWREVEAAGDVLAYEREHAGRRLLVVLNLGSAACDFPLRTPLASRPVLLSTHLDRKDRVTGTVRLRADEGVVVEL
jgi:alpha-glucosidase